MNIRLKCGCGARFVVSDELRGRVVECSECGRKTRVPQAVATGSPARSPEPIAFVTEDPGERPSRAAVPVAAELTAPAEPASAWHGRSGRHGAPRPAVEESAPITRRKKSRESGGAGWKWLLLVFVLLVPVGVVGVLIALPYFQPKDPRELVAAKYLAAVRREDWDAANRLSVLKLHPRLTGVERVGQAEAGTRELTGKFQGIAEFHAQIKDAYAFNSETGRFSPKNELGAGLGALSKLEQAKKQAEDKVAENKADPGRSRKSPEEQMLDDAIASYGAIGDLAKDVGGLFSSQKLGPTYADLLKQTDVPLTDAERMLAGGYARDPAKWDRLLGRSFLDLPDLGNFSLKEVEIVATIRTEGQSLSEPGRPITLRLVQFSMGSLDTGWRVWQAE